MTEYRPNPVDTDDVELTPELLQLTEQIAENVHEVWAVGRMKEGWTYGQVKDADKKQTPWLVPYGDLPESEKDYDRNTALATLKLIVKLGYEIRPAAERVTRAVRDEAAKDDQSKTYGEFKAKDLAVVYYSFEGSTEAVAKMIRDKTGADLVKLMPETEPPRTGFGKFFYGGKSVILKERTRIRKLMVDLNDYKAVIVASPVWAGSCPPAVEAFLERRRMEDKDVYIIACSGSGKGEKAIRRISEGLKGNRIMSAMNLASPAKSPAETEQLINGLLRDIKDTSLSKD